MGLRTQLQLLVWKNISLRKRQKLRAVVEITAPLALFLILMLVKSRGLKQNIPECHFDEKAMPSAGLIPFIQKLICTLNNTCRANLTSDDFYGISDNYEDSLLTYSITNAQLIVNDEGTMATLIKLSQALASLAQILTEVISTPNFQADPIIISHILNNPDNIPTLLANANLSVPPSFIQSVLNAEIQPEGFRLITSMVLLNTSLSNQNPGCNADFISRLLKFQKASDLNTVTNYFCQLSPTDQQKIMQIFISNIDPTRIQTLSENMLFGSIANNINLFDFIFQVEKARTALSEVRKNDNLKNVFSVLSSYMMLNMDNATSSLDLFLCGPNHAILSNFLSEDYDSTFRAQPFFESQEQIISNYIYDNSTSSFCNTIFEGLENKTYTKYLWDQLKPIVRGKILYTPDTPATRKIITMVNSTFEDLNNIQKMGSYWLEISDNIHNYIESNKSAILNFLQEFSKDPEKALDDNPQFYLAFEMISNIFSSQNMTLNATSILISLGNFLSKDENNSSSITLRDVLETLDDIAGNISNYLECFELDKFEPVTDENDVISRGLNLLENHKLWAAVVFENMQDNSSDLPPYLRYKIRMDSDKVDSTKRVEDRYWRPGSRTRPTVDLKYITFGFAYLQDMIEHAIILLQTGTTERTGVYLQQFPYPCYVYDQFFNAISRTLPMFMTLAWVYTAAMIIKGIVYEKEKRLKETMKVMGLGNGVHWAAWFIDAFIFMFVTVILLVLILKYGKVIENSSPWVLLLFMFSFTLASITQAFLISVFFSKANLAAASGGIIFFVLYLPYSFLIRWEEIMSTSSKLLSCLLSNVAFGFGCSYFARYEEQVVGIQWNNFASSPIPGDNFNLGTCIFMLFFDTILYSLLTWYIETVFPGQYGIPKPWYFPVSKRYWCGEDFYAPVQHSSHGFDADQLGENVNFEKDPTHLPLGVSINNLSKVYSSNKVAVDGLYLNFYEGQITSFLGHNGAGKTTTMSILTGLFPPTTGSAKIYGKDIRTQMDEIRKSLGTCPQHNVLFDNLTVAEHLWFYARLKGMSAKEVHSEMNQMIKDIGLPHKQNELSKNLSGGMQRKLSLAVAFVGGSRTVILDEPTAGIDPYARRSIWDLLLKYKKNRTIILSTHHMDEADLLGDRIAIISQGKLCCCGSSLFLKGHYGKGYYLTLVKKDATLLSQGADNQIFTQTADNHVNSPGADDQEESLEAKTITTNDSPLKSSAEQEKVITSFIQRYVPESEMVENVATEICYCLPSKYAQSGDFVKLFDALDRDLENLGILSYGISDTSLEEVFLKVAENKDVPLITDLNTSIDPEIEVNDISQPLYYDTKYQVTGSSLIQQQFVALCIKRFHHAKRSRKGFFCQIVLPVLFVLIAMVFTLIVPPIEEEPALELNPWLYGPPNYIFYSVENEDSQNGKLYADSLLNPPGLGTRCMAREPIRGKPCVPVNYDLSDLYVSPNFSHLDPYGYCECKTGYQVCPNNAGGPLAPNIVVNTTDIILNMNGRNITDWILTTTASYRKNRYGGFTFGVENQLASLNVSAGMAVINILISIVYPDWPEMVRNISLWNGTNLIAKKNVKSWFDNKGWAASVSYMNTLNNAILRANLSPDQDPLHYGISVISHPLNFTMLQLQEEVTLKGMSSLLISICVIFAMSFVPASFVLFLIEERTSNAKHLQFVSGVNPVIYWIANFTWDMCNYIIPVILCVFIFLAFNEQAYVSSQNAPVLISLLLLYGWASIPMMYPASFIFDVPSSAFVALSSINLFIGMTSTIATFVLELLHDEELKEIASILRQVFLIFPQYCLGRGLMDMASNQVKADAFSSFNLKLFQDPFDWHFAGRNIFCMFIQGILFFVFALLIEYRFFYKAKEMIPMDRPYITEDIDVSAERQRVLSGGATSDVLRLENLSKVYPRGKHPAVDHLYVGVPPGECFGLLGVNGAGKTTTFKMLTGQIPVTSGNAYIDGNSILSDIVRVHQSIGYCPQFDALHSLLTGKEHLQLYARLKGIPKDKVNEIANWGIMRLELSQYRNKISETYSGGNKRKLSTAISLVGNPSVIFLDEPTTGMDPKARRFLWNSILDIVKTKSSVVLTSHSMEECEALCTRLAIMVNGQFKCLGSTQHLKNRFGEGYTLIIRLGGIEPKVRPTSLFIEDNFPGAVLKESHHNQLHFQLPSKNLKLSYLFNNIESAREELGIEDYSVSQTTLDQVFINFAKLQTDLLDDEVQVTLALTSLERNSNLPGIELQATFTNNGHLVSSQENGYPVHDNPSLAFDV